MTDRDAFIRAIIAAPDDDVPRIVFADWLDEHGEKERAELIRLQCELAKLPEPEIKTMKVPRDDPQWHPGGFCPKCPCRYHALRRRERELLTEHEDTWFPFSSLIRVGVGGRYAIQREWRCGFVESINYSWEDWRQHADAIRAATPLRKVRLTTLPGEDVLHEQWQLQWPSIEFDLKPPEYIEWDWSDLVQEQLSAWTA